MDFIGFVLSYLIFFLAGVGIGAFVVGASLRRIADETKRAVADEFTKALTDAKAEEAAIKKAL